MNSTPLTPTLGEKITGIDLRRRLADDDVVVLRRLFDDRHLLFFHDPDLTAEDQIALAATFGPVADEQRLGLGYSFVSNVLPGAAVPEGALPFHSDMAFTPTPYLGLALYAMDVPSDGAPTLFADAIAAARSLPDELRDGIDGRGVINVFDYTVIADHRMREAEVMAGSPRWEHPVLGRHPRTGEMVLFVNALHTDRITGVSAEDSEALLAEIMAVLYRQENTYEHRWAQGDLLVWDNVAVHHGRRMIAPDEPRTLRRVVLAERFGRDLVADADQVLVR
jgi:taurine dioxygenase